MGALHAGHLSLVERSRRENDLTVVSIFVNPTQFGAGEDFDEYPRTLEQDVSLCRERGVDLVYAPAVDGMYPEGFQTHVQVEVLTTRLEGAHRPTHFQKASLAYPYDLVLESFGPPGNFFVVARTGLECHPIWLSVLLIRATPTSDADRVVE